MDDKALEYLQSKVNKAQELRGKIMQLDGALYGLGKAEGLYIVLSGSTNPTLGAGRGGLGSDEAYALFAPLIAEAVMGKLEELKEEFEKL